ncbi:MAG: class I SAM-dependent methyltransferase [Planctomycetota bacterium]
MQDKMMLRNCPVCGRNNQSEERMEKISRDHWNLKTCPECSFVYLENPPLTENLEEEFAWEKTFQQETERRRETTPIKYRVSNLVKTTRSRYFRRQKLRKLIKQYSDPGNVLDIGCGWGGTLMNNLPDGYVPFGLEVSKELAEQATQAFSPLGGSVVFGDAQDAFSQLDEDSFVAVTMIAILEHVTDPISMLHESCRVLQPGAVAIVKVPNFAAINRRIGGAEWCGLRFPDHVNYFTPGSLVECGRRAGLNVVRFGFLDRQPTSDNMWCVFQKPQRSIAAAA